MTLPNDIARCPGITEVGYRLPVRLCATCARWQSIGTGGERTPHMEPAAVIRLRENSASLACDYRISEG